MTGTMTAPAGPGSASPANARPADANPAGASPAGGATKQGPRRQWRLPVVLAAIVLLGGGLIAWLQPGAGPTGYLDPGNAGANGGRALATILAERGTQVTTVTSAATASQAATKAATKAASNATILVTNPDLLSSAQLSTIAHAPADLVLPDPDSAELAALAPEVTMAEQATAGTLNPDCTLPDATFAGNADLGGTLLKTTARAAERCYPADGHPSLVRYSAGGKVITVLGTGTPLTNAQLGNHGNAALAMNLLRSARQLIWLVPTASPSGPPPTGKATFISLIPRPVYMVTVQLLIAVLLLALWRVRRLGPIVAERLPAVVRASETTEGHGRLYHARRARDRAAQILRDAAANRMKATTGLPPDASPELTAATLARRTRTPVAEITETLSGPPPADDAALVALADRLDELERKAGAR
jgi:hypothetical protein